MRVSSVALIGMTVVLLASCGGTINYDPASNTDTSPPAVNLLIARAGQPDLEVQGRTTPPPSVVGSYGDPAPATRQQFSVLATATDNESGIRSIRLSMTRTVCFVSSSGAVSQAYSGTVTRKEVEYTDPRNAPTQASVGDTGVIDNSGFGTDPANISSANLLVWTNANQELRAGVGVSTRWNMEARNFAGQVTYSNSIVVIAGNTSCVTTP